jgi:glycosyltransferase involved in cell wall biosynthesis
VIYEYIDDLEVFPHDLREMQRYHQIMCRDANIVVTTARKLYDQVKPIRPDALLNPNAVDYEHFAPARSKDIPVPDELRPIVEKRQPVIGYYGALARWFDYNLLKAVAALRPNYQFVLIGLDYDHTLTPSRLLEMPNVYWLGVKPYQELPKYLAHFNVAMIPFVISEITHSTSPIKLFEYMAGQKPVVVTPMKESLHTPGILAGRTPHEFARSLDEALKLQSDPSYLELSDKVAQENTWDARARQILGEISRQDSLPKE